jgi:2-haloacid dehalogenase
MGSLSVGPSILLLDVNEMLMMVAAHPWDVEGAKRAGLLRAWINRGELPFPSLRRQPDVTAPDLLGLAPALLEAP